MTGNRLRRLSVRYDPFPISIYRFYRFVRNNAVIGGPVRFFTRPEVLAAHVIDDGESIAQTFTSIWSILDLSILWNISNRFGFTALKRSVWFQLSANSKSDS